MAVYLSGASCARVSNQSLLNKLAKESNIIIQHDAWNHMFANANTMIYNTSGQGCYRLISYNCRHNGNSDRSGGSNVKVGYGVFIQRILHFIFGGTGLIKAFGEGRFNRRLKKLKDHWDSSWKNLFCLEVRLHPQRNTRGCLITSKLIWEIN